MTPQRLRAYARQRHRRADPAAPVHSEHLFRSSAAASAAADAAAAAAAVHSQGHAPRDTVIRHGHPLERQRGRRRYAAGAARAAEVEAALLHGGRGRLVAPLQPRTGRGGGSLGQRPCCFCCCCCCWRRRRRRWAKERREVRARIPAVCKAAQAGAGGGCHAHDASSEHCLQPRQRRGQGRGRRRGEARRPLVRCHVAAARASVQQRQRRQRWRRFR